jgi:hypothetical protein
LPYSSTQGYRQVSSTVEVSMARNWSRVRWPLLNSSQKTRKAFCSPEVSPSAIHASTPTSRKLAK